MAKIRISLTIDRELIKHIDEIVKAENLKSRSFFIEKNLKEIIGGHENE